MARLTKPLTNTEVNNAKPKAKEYTLSDGNGLYLLVKPNGSKLWRFNYYKPFTQPKKRALIGVGKFPDISLQQAREIREKYLSLLAQNIDPQQHKIRTEQAEQTRLLSTFRAVAEHWKESKASNIKALTLKKYWAIVEHYLLPVLADYPVSDITPATAKIALEIPYRQGKAEMYRKSIKLLNAILNHAVYFHHQHRRTTPLHDRAFKRAPAQHKRIATNGNLLPTLTD